MTTASTLRTIAGTINSQRTVEGGGFNVRRPFPTATMDHIDPFLLVGRNGPCAIRPWRSSRVRQATRIVVLKPLPIYFLAPWCTKTPQAHAL